MATQYEGSTFRRPSMWKMASGDGASSAAVEDMAARGRAPSFNSAGRIRGFRSVPGAGVATNDNLRPTTIVGATGTQAHTSSWDQFFRKVNPMESMSPVTSGQDQAFVGDAPPSTPAQNISAAIAGNTSWMGGNGINYAPPPVADPVVPPAPKTGWVTTTPQQSSAIATQYATPPVFSDNPWGKPLPYA